MIYTYLSLILLIIIDLYILKKYKDVLCPPFVLTSIYLSVFLFFIIFKFIFNSKYSLNYFCLYFPIGQVVFAIAYDFIYKKKIILNENLGKNTFYTTTTIFNLFVFFQFICLVFSYYHMFISTFNIYHYDFLIRIKLGKWIEYTPPYFIRLIRTISIAFSIISFNAILNLKLKSKLIFYVQFIIGILFLFILNSRQWSFILFIPLIFIFLKSLKLQIKKFIFVIFVISLVFILYIYFQAIVINGTASLEFLRLYLVSGIVSFTEWVSKPFQLYHGKFTFRFFLSILKKLNLINIDIPYLPMNYLEVKNLDWSTELGNVYTFYYGYVKDFGLLYGLFIQFIIGAFHGFLYKKANANSMWLTIYGIFCMPLVVHFFMDHYFSHISLWIQMIIPVIIFYKTNIFLKKNNV